MVVLCLDQKYLIPWQNDSVDFFDSSYALRVNKDNVYLMHAESLELVAEYILSLIIEEYLNFEM